MSDGDSIEVWDDISGEGNNAMQTEEVNQPIYKTNVLNGKSVVRFDGSNTRLKTNTFTELPQPMTVFIVWETYADGTRFAFDGPTRLSLFQGTQGGENIVFHAGNVISYDRSLPFNALINTVIFNGSESKIWENGENKTSGDAGDSGLERLLIGSRHGKTHHLDGDVAEILIFNSELSESEREEIEQYLDIKWLQAPGNSFQ